MPTEGNVYVDNKPITGASGADTPEARPFVFENRRARDASMPPESEGAASSLEQLLESEAAPGVQESRWTARQQRLQELGSTMLLGAGAALQKGNELAQRAKVYAKQKWDERKSPPEHRSELHGEHKLTERHWHAPTYGPAVHGEHKLENSHVPPPEHRSNAGLRQRLQAAKAGGVVGVGGLIYERSREYAGRTKNYFTDSERAGERKNRRIGGAVLAAAGVIGLALALRYGVDMPFDGSEPKPHDSYNDDFLDDWLDGEGHEPEPSSEPPKVEEPPLNPPPEFAQNKGNLSSGQNPWSEGADYAQSLGYDLDPNNQQDLMTLDAIKDRVLVLNNFPNPTRLPVGTEVSLPPPEVIDELYKLYH